MLSQHMCKTGTFLFLILAIALTSTAHAAQFHDARVRHIPERFYQQTATDLIDNATTGIHISMYAVSVQEEGVGELFDDLAEALGRGVLVEVWVNTQLPLGRVYERASEIQELADRGAGVYEVKDTYKLHDKILIVDGRYVLEGSANWTESGFDKNLENVTLIDSTGLAADKIERLRGLPLPGDARREYEKPVYEPDSAAGLPDMVSLPDTLLLDEHKLPAMVPDRDDRSMDLYLLLVRESYLRGKRSFFLNLEYAAGLLQMPAAWTDSAKRRQLIKTLKKLERRYRLIKAEFRHGKDTQVTLSEFTAGRFAIPSTMIDPATLAQQLPSATLMQLISEYLKQSDQTVNDFTREQIKQRFHITPDAQTAARQAILKHKDN